MNATLKSSAVVLFKDLISKINNCEINAVRYGQPLLYIKYHEFEFTDQKISSYFIRKENSIIDVFIESIDEEHIKVFDLFISNPKYNIRWDRSIDYDRSLFQLLDYFVESITNFTLLEITDPNTLKEKKIRIRNVSIKKNSAFIEFSIDDNLIIMELNFQKKKMKNICSLVFGHSDISNALLVFINRIQPC